MRKLTLPVNDFQRGRRTRGGGDPLLGAYEFNDGSAQFRMAGLENSTGARRRPPSLGPVGRKGLVARLFVIQARTRVGA